MNLPVTIVLCLKLLFIFSAVLKVFTSNIQIKTEVKTEVKIVRFLYYNASLLLFLYWFNPWTNKICLEGEDKFIVFSFMVIELLEEILPLV
jgi:hypothetical protein